MKRFGRLAGYSCALGGLMLLTSDSLHANDAFVPYGAWRGNIRYVRGPFRTKETMRWGNGITPTGGMVLMHGLTVAGEVFAGAGALSKDADVFAKETPSPATVESEQFTDAVGDSKVTLEALSKDLANQVNSLQGAFTKDFQQPALQRLALVADLNHRLATRIATAKDPKNIETPLAEKSKESWAKVSALLQPYRGAAPPVSLQGQTLRAGYAAWKQEEVRVGRWAEAWGWLSGLANADTKFYSDSTEAKSAGEFLTHVKANTLDASPSVADFFKVIEAVNNIPLDDVMK